MKKICGFTIAVFLFFSLYISTFAQTENKSTAGSFDNPVGAGSGSKVSEKPTTPKSETKKGTGSFDNPVGAAPEKTETKEVIKPPATKIFAPYSGIRTALRGFTAYNTVAENDFIEAKQLGVNVLRIMLMDGDLVLPHLQYIKEPNNKILPEKLAILKRLVELGIKYGIIIMIDVHEMPGLIRWSESENSQKVFTLWARNQAGEKHRRLLVEIWQQLSQTFSSYPDGALIYEIFNEPEPKDNDWNSPDSWGYLWEWLQDDCIKAIRQNDKKHNIVGAPPYSYKVESLKNWRPSETVLNDGKIIISAHCYYPYNITMQWKAWDYYQKNEDVSKFNKYPGQAGGIFWDKNRLSKNLEPVRIFLSNYPNLKVVINEFSIIRVTPGAAQYLRDLISLFEELGVGWTYHVYKEMAWSKTKKVPYTDSMWELDWPKPDDRLEIMKKAFKAK